jgi:uncharacterized iron-regulated membrane protein
MILAKAASCVATRRFWVALHRYSGLYMALFISIAGITGAILAFDNEINEWLRPETIRVPVQNTPPLDPYTLRERALAMDPRIRINFINLNMKPGEVPWMMAEPKEDPKTGKPYQLGYQWICMNPYTGEVTAKIKEYGSWPLTKESFIPMVFEIHYALFSGRVGTILLGVAALIWTVDCFVGLFLTFPRPAAKEGGCPLRWIGRWAPSWQVAWRGKTYRFQFSLHRALGLWLWPMLFVFAISSVSFNLPEVYNPVMKKLFGSIDAQSELPDLPKPKPDPGLEWRKAGEIGHHLCAEVAAREGIHLHQAEGTIYFIYIPEKGVFSYSEHGNLDIGYHQHALTVYFDGETGALKAWESAAGKNAGITFTKLVTAIHTRTIGGKPIQFLVCLVGLLIPVISFSGIYLWWRKRKTRLLLSQSQQPS